jgi:hypothetical protein
MKIVGCDLHAQQQSIAMVDTENGENPDYTCNRSVTSVNACSRQ